MAEIRTKLITELPLGQQLDGSEILPVQQDGVTRKITTQDVIAFTKRQDYATWTNVASTRLLTNFLTAQNVFLVRQRSEFGNPQFFIGSLDTAPESLQYQITSLSGFRFFYHEDNNAFVFTRQVSSLSSIQTLTAYYIDRFARTFIENLSTANTLSANKILITDNTANNALEIHQTGTGNALLIYDQAGDPTPFVVDGQGRVGIQTLNPNTELTIFGNLSASSNLSASNVFVLGNIGVGTSGRPVPEKLTVFGNISASELFRDSQGNSREWNSSYNTWNALSGFHQSARSFVNENSSTLIQTRTEVFSQSANNRSGYATWNALSGFHQNARSFVNENSSTLIQARSEVLANSGNWATYNYVNIGFLPLSGGTITGNILNISAKTFYSNDVVILGSLTATQFSVIQAQVLPITATRLNIDNELTVGKSLNVGTTAQIDGVFRVLGQTTIDDIIVATNNVYTSGIFVDPKGNSDQWNSGYNTWNGLSAGIVDARTFNNNNSSTLVQVRTEVLSKSANWNSVYGYVNSVSTNYVLNGGNSPTDSLIIGTNNTQSLQLETNGSVRTTINSTGNVGINTTTPNERLTVSDSISASNNIFAGNLIYDLQGNSSQWNSGYSTWNALSGFHQNARSFVNENSSTLIQIRTEVFDTSANNRSGYAIWNSLSAGIVDARTFNNNNSSTFVQVRTEVLAKSGNWNSGYSTWNSLSAGIVDARAFSDVNSSSNIQVRTEVLAKSANWNSVYGYVNSVSTNYVLNGGNSPTDSLIIGTNNTQSLQLETNGSVRTTINSTGNVGINTTTPNERLTVSGNVSSNSLIYDSLGNSSNWNSVYSTVNSTSASQIAIRGSVSLTTGQTTISVATHNPATNIADVYLNGVKLVAGVDFNDTGTSIDLTEPAKNNDYRLEYIIGGLAGGIVNSVQKSGDTMTGALTVSGLTVNGPFTTSSSLATPTMVLSRQNNTIEGGELQFCRSNDNTSKYIIDVFGNGDNPDLRFFEKLGTSPSFTYPVRMVIQGSTGNVGIGTTNPSNARLGIYQNSTSNNALSITNDSANTADACAIYNYAPNVNALNIFSNQNGNALYINQTGSGNAVYIADQNLPDSTPFVIDSAGKVGIGLQPTAKLDIVSEFGGLTGSPDIRFSGIVGGALQYINYVSQGSWGGLTRNGDKTFVYFGSGGVDTGGFTVQQWCNQSIPRGFRISENGNFGISTALPNERLTVVGNISASGKLFADVSDLNFGRLPKNKALKFRERNACTGSGNKTCEDATFVISQDGTLNVAGYSAQGFGMGNQTYQTGGYAPLIIPLSAGERIEKFWISNYTIYALTNSGHLWGTGQNNTGQLGQNNVTKYEYWVPIIGNVIDFSVSEGNVTGMHCLAVRSDGYVYGWGGNDQAAGRPLGLPKGNYLTPTLISGASNSISPQSLGARRIKKVFAFKGYQDDTYSWSFAIDTNDKLHVCGSNHYGCLGMGDTAARNNFQESSFFADNVYALGYSNSRASSYILRGGQVWSTGRNLDGQLGLGVVGDAGNRTTFTLIPNLNNVVDLAVTVSASYEAAVVALRSDGTIRTWGSNTDGVLGYGGTTNSGSPGIPTDSLDAYGNVYPNLPFITKIIGGGGFAQPNFVALDINGDIWTSGHNSNGQKGIGVVTQNNKFSKALRDTRIKFVDIDNSSGNTGAQTGFVAEDENGDIYYTGHCALGAGTGGLHYYETQVAATPQYKRTRFAS